MMKFDTIFHQANMHQLAESVFYVTSYIEVGGHDVPTTPPSV